MARSIWIVNFKVYNPPHKALNKAARNGEPLPWGRLQNDWYDDKDIGALPEQVRWIWPAVLALSCKSRPPGRVDMTNVELARELRTSEENVKVAVDHLWKRGRLRYSRPKEMAGATDEGGEGVV